MLRQNGAPHLQIIAPGGCGVNRIFVHQHGFGWRCLVAPAFWYYDAAIQSSRARRRCLCLLPQHPSRLYRPPRAVDPFSRVTTWKPTCTDTRSGLKTCGLYSNACASFGARPDVGLDVEREPAAVPNMNLSVGTLSGVPVVSGTGTQSKGAAAARSSRILRLRSEKAAAPLRMLRCIWNSWRTRPRRGSFAPR
jgi:hypothetical protein